MPLINFEYILNHYEQENHEIPYSYDQIEWKIGETYRIRVGNVYDPSKLWIVHYDRELTLFHDYLNDFYKQNKDQYKILEETIKRNIYCVVFTDGAYYRGVIVDKPKLSSLGVKVCVFLFDFGYTCAVTVDNIYYLNEKMYEVPRFAIRASLNGVEPNDGDMWSNEVADRFKNLIVGKILVCIVEGTDEVLRTLHVRIGEVVSLNKIQDISNVLIQEKLGRVTRRSKMTDTVIKGYLVAKVKYPFLFPSHQAIETGLVPSSVSVAENLKQLVTSSMLFEPYYSNVNSQFGSDATNIAKP